MSSQMRMLMQTESRMIMIIRRKKKRKKIVRNRRDVITGNGKYRIKRKSTSREQPKREGVTKEIYFVLRSSQMDFLRYFKTQSGANRNSDLYQCLWNDFMLVLDFPNDLNPNVNILSNKNILHLHCRHHVNSGFTMFFVTLLDMRKDRLQFNRIIVTYDGHETHTHAKSMHYLWISFAYRIL